MAKSKAKKQREKIVREGGLDPQNRQSFFTKNKDGFNFTTQKAGKTFSDHQQKLGRKIQQNLKQMIKRQSYDY